MNLPVGSFINMAAVIGGGALGMLLGARLPDRVRAIVFQGLGLCTLVIGMQMAFKTANPLIMIFSILSGAIIGELLRLEDAFARAGEALKAKLRSGNPRFTDGFVTATLLFCIGSMAILGPFDEGLRGDRTIVLTKSILDCFAAIALASAYGVGVLFSALPLFAYQGGLTMFAGVLQPLLGPAVMNELTATGGLMVIGIGINLLEIKRIPLANMLPALLTAVLLASFFG